MTETPFISIIIPVHNGGSALLRNLHAIHYSSYSNWELIVIDDGSTDGSALLARQLGARVFSTGSRNGPAVARNLGARLAKGDYLLFLDADCQVHLDTLANITAEFQADPTLDALFGSYDDMPAAPNFVAQYKNLFHHYVHQHGQTEASTFWTGCGAMKRKKFLALGGFDVQRYRRPAIEDIELGHRLKKSGGRIRLAKHVQVQHLKVWTFAGLLRSDIFDRGVPWTQLILRGRIFARDLNLQTHNRISVIAVWGLLVALLVAFWQPVVVVISAALAFLLLWLNLELYRFFYQKRGLLFTLGVIPMHWLYYLYNAIAFGIGLALFLREKLLSDKSVIAEPLTDRAESDGV